MPIYGFGVSGAPWTRCVEMKKETLAKFIEIFNKAKKPYQVKNPAFYSSIKNNTQLVELYIASYDISKSNIPVGLYDNYLETLIQEANLLLSSKKKYNNYKFDIMGNWEMGKVILMEKK